MLNSFKRNWLAWSSKRHYQQIYLRCFCTPEKTCFWLKPCFKVWIFHSCDGGIPNVCRKRSSVQRRPWQWLHCNGRNSRTCSIYVSQGRAVPGLPLDVEIQEGLGIYGRGLIERFVRKLKRRLAKRLNLFLDKLVAHTSLRKRAERNFNLCWAHPTSLRFDVEQKWQEPYRLSSIV